jgi:hypothetical protein
MADNLRDILDIAKREMPDVPPEVWARIEGRIRLNFGGQRPYIASHKKRHALTVIAEIGESQDITRIAALLGISVRRVQQLNKLR